MTQVDTSAPASNAGSSTYNTGPRTTATRERERMRHDRATVHEILDEALVCHLGYIVDGEPVVLPTLFVRDGETLYLHGSTGSRPLRLAAGEGLPVCVTVTHLDGLVLARSAFHHSVNYRSVVARGNAILVHEVEVKQRALDAIVDKIADGRSADCRPPTQKELAQTAVLALDLDEVSAKVREGGVEDEPEDMTLPYWAGVVPLHHRFGRPRAAADLAAGVGIPGYLT